MLPGVAAPLAGLESIMKLSCFAALVCCGFLFSSFSGTGRQNCRREHGRVWPASADSRAWNRRARNSSDRLCHATACCGISNQGRAGASSYVESPEGVVTAVYPVTPVYQNATLPGVPESAAAAQNLQEETRAKTGRLICDRHFLLAENYRSKTSAWAKSQPATKPWAEQRRFVFLRMLIDVSIFTTVD